MQTHWGKKGDRHEKQCMLDIKGKALLRISRTMWCTITSDN